MANALRRTILFGDGPVTPGSGGSTPVVPPPLALATFGAIFKYNTGFPTKFCNSDTWYNVWADDDQIYTLSCDFFGWQGVAPSSNFAISKLSDFSVGLTGTLVNSMAPFGVSGASASDGATWKASGFLCVSGVFYIFTTRMIYGQNNLPSNIQTALSSQIIKSVDHGVTWTPLPPGVAQPYTSPMFPGPRFASPSFVMYGKDYVGNTIHNSNLYVYAVSPNGVWDNDDSLILGRCLISDLPSLDATKWSFYQGGDGMVGGNWGVIGTAALIASAAGKISQTSLQYLPSLGRYVMFEWYYPNLAAQMNARDIPDCIWDLYESPTPWGPWTKFQTTEWNPSGLYNPIIIQKSLSTNGGTDVVLATTGNFWNGDAQNGDYTLTLVPAHFSNTPLSGKHAYNVGKLGYFEGNYPFIDIFKVGVGWNQTSGSVTKDAEGWLTAIAPGASADSFVAVNAPWVPPGNYKIVSTSLATISLAFCSGLSNIVDGVAHLATFTVPDNGSDLNAWLNVWIKPAVVNNTASPISVLDFKIYRVQNEALLLGGGDDAVFDPEYLAGLQGAATLRFLEWMGMNHQGGAYTPDGMWKFTDFGVQTLNKASYAHIEGANGPCIPAMLVLCRKLGARPWLPIGNAGNIALLNYTHADNLFHKAAWFNNTLDGENRFVNGVGIRATNNPPSLSASGMTPRSTTYYVVNAGGATFQLAATVGGIPIVASSVDIACYGNGIDLANFNSAIWCQVTGIDEYTDMFLPFAQCVFANDPACHPLIDYSNECWNQGYGSYSYLKEIIAGVELNAGFASTGYLWMLMKLYKAFEVTFPTAQVGRIVGWFTGILEGFLAMTGPGEGLNHLDSANIFDSTKTYGQILLQAPSRCYYAVAPYINPANSATDYASASQRGPGGFKASDAYTFNGNSTVYTDAFWDSVFAASIYYNQNDSQAGMTAVFASLDTYLPGVNRCFYEWAQQTFYHDSFADPRWKVTGDSLSAYLANPAGAAMYERAWAATIEPYNLSFVNFYNAEGSWIITTQDFSRWGIRDKNTDNYVSTWFRTK